jgi:hypothetical protein
MMEWALVGLLGLSGFFAWQWNREARKSGKLTIERDIAKADVAYWRRAEKDARDEIDNLYTQLAESGGLSVPSVFRDESMPRGASVSEVSRQPVRLGGENRQPADN